MLFARIVVLLFLTVLLGGPGAQADVLKSVAEDFKPLSGYVVMSKNGEVIIDLDATRGIRLGDLFGKLRHLLPGLNWKPFDMAQRKKPKHPDIHVPMDADLVFILSGDRLDVRDFNFMLLRQYSMTASSEASAPDFQSSPIVSRPPGVMPKSPPVQQTVSPGYHAEFKHLPSLGDLPGSASLMADFITYRDSSLMVTTDGRKVEIFSVEEPITSLTRTGLSFPGQIFSVQWWKPKSREDLHLVTVSWFDNQVAGSIFRLESGHLVPVLDSFPSILAAFDMDQDLIPETLLSQQFKNETFFGNLVSELRLSDDGIDYQRPPFPLPRRFTVLGSQFADLTGDGNLETIFVRNSILYIYAGKEQLYKSAKQMGGSISMLTYDIDPEAKHVRTTTVAFEVPPVAMDLDGDGIRELLAVTSERSILGQAGMGAGVTRSWLTAFKYRNGMFVEGVFGEEFKDPLQGLGVLADAIYLVSSETGSYKQGGKSRLHSYPVAN